jgi:2',3'-cyclic-nucleotide 2'-phosphodiesterase (5'-nucleotidase family)
MRRAVPGADAAFANAGSVRDVLPEGPLTFGRLHHVMPFDNQLSKLELTGAELRNVVATNLSQGEHGVLSVSGITADASCAGGKLVVTLKRPDGTVVKDDDTLAVVTSDFLALGGDGLLPGAHVSSPKGELETGTSVLDALISGLKERHTVAPDDPTLLDPEHPRISLASPWPLRCAAPPKD